MSSTLLFPEKIWALPDDWHLENPRELSAKYWLSRDQIKLWKEMQDNPGEVYTPLILQSLRQANWSTWCKVVQLFTVTYQDVDLRYSSQCSINVQSVYYAFYFIKFTFYSLWKIFFKIIHHNCCESRIFTCKRGRKGLSK